MAKLKLKAMSMVDLIALRDQINAALSKKIEGERSQLQNRLDALSAFGAGGRVAKRRGRPPGTTPTRRSAAAGKKVAPKYRGPEGELWTGRGNTPRWMVALEKDGSNRDSFLIDR